jgi:hypothetical protein
MRRLLQISLFALAATGCGVEAQGTARIALRMHQLGCEIPPLQAKLEVTGQAEDCPLEVSADRTVSGVCPAIPTGAVLEFRLLYFLLTEGPGDPLVQLATAIESLDLTETSDREVTLSFPASSLNRDYDDDMDGQSNIAEVCAGTNPRG